MAKIETFDASDLTSIINFGGKLHVEFDETIVNEEFLFLNVKKTIDALKQIKENEYLTERTQQLLRVMQNMAFYCYSGKVIAEIIKQDLYSIYSRMIDFQLKSKNLDHLSLSVMLGAMSSLTYHSVEIAKEDVKYNFHAKLFELIDYFNIVNAITENDDETLKCYESSIMVLHKISTYRETREALIGIQTVSRLLDEAEKLDTVIKLREELKYVKLTLVSVVANLLDDQELDTLPISDELVQILIGILSDIIKKAPRNQRIHENSKYYIFYTICYIDTYVNANKHLSKIISLAVNDTIKQKLFDAGILPMLQELLTHGNEVEIERTSELLCSLCFNENVAKYVRENESLMQLIKHIQTNSTKESTKRSCKQIIEMVNNTIQKRVSSAKTVKNNGHVMISYNHKYKEECLKIHEELKKKGYNTWMDVNSTFTDLHDAMAEAIEKASIVLVCYSYEYKTSNNCRLEAQYAFKLNKNIIPIKLQPKYDPDGWLGMGLATKLYVDFSKDINNQVSYDNLFRQIDSLLTKSSNEVQQRPPSVKASVQKVESQVSLQARPPSRNIRSASKQNETNAKRWNEEDVKNWLINNNMSSFVNVFKGYRGIALKALYEMKQKDYTLFYSTLEKEIESSKENVKTVEKLNFIECLQSLFDN